MVVVVVVVVVVAVLVSKGPLRKSKATATTIIIQYTSYHMESTAV